MRWLKDKTYTAAETSVATAKACASWAADHPYKAAAGAAVFAAVLQLTATRTPHLLFAKYIAGMATMGLVIGGGIQEYQAQTRHLPSIAKLQQERDELKARLDNERSLSAEQAQLLADQLQRLRTLQAQIAENERLIAQRESENALPPAEEENDGAAPAAEPAPTPNQPVDAQATNPNRLMPAAIIEVATELSDSEDEGSNTSPRNSSI